MTKKIFTLQLPVKLVELAKEHFHTENASFAIKSSIEFAFLHCYSELQSNTLSIYHLLNVEERKTPAPYSVRLDEDALNALRVATSRPISDAVKHAIVCTLSAQTLPTPKPSKLINILGSKWDKRMQSAIKQVFDTANKSWEKTIETCAGALGIHANFPLADDEIINDDDVEKINLFQCIQQKPFEFKDQALSFECTEKAFENLKDEKPNTQKIPDVNRAVHFFLLNFFSYRNTGHTFNEKKSKQALVARLDSVAFLSERLKHVKITNNDIFSVIKKHKKEKNTLFIVDPIYLDTNVYKSRTLGTKTEHGVEFGWNEHQRLAKELRSIKGDFIYFCRITATRHKNLKNKLVDSPESIRERDIEMKGRIDDLYWNHGFHYIDVPLDNGTVERIITSFPFKGSTPYNQPPKKEVW